MGVAQPLLRRLLEGGDPRVQKEPKVVNSRYCPTRGRHRADNGLGTTTGLGVGSVQLLLATDDPNLARALRSALESQDIAMEHCPDPNDILGRVWRDLPDVILVDLDLALASGFTLLLRLKENSFSQGIPVLVTSANYSQDSDEVQLCSRELSATAFWRRPFSMLEIASLLRDLVDTEGDEGDRLKRLRASREGGGSLTLDPDPTTPGPVRLDTLRLRRREAARERREQSLAGPVPLDARRSRDLGGVTASDLQRELEGMRLATPLRVLGVSRGAPPGDIRQAARRKVHRLQNLRDDVGLVPEVRVAAQQLLELVRFAEASLLGRLS